MKTRNKIVAVLGVLALATVGLAACDGSSTPKKPDRGSQLAESEKNFNERTAPEVSGEVEYNNYVDAQELYDDPSSIIWCTMFPASPAAPIVTVPIRGKLTSSTVSFYPNQRKEFIDGGEYNMEIMVEAQSVDGMYHGSPPPYRYGFTPTGQYVDFFEIPTFCTTALTEFGRETLSVVLK